MLLNTPRIVSSSQMRSMDEETIKGFGIPGEVLMENAGRTASRVIAEKKDLNKDNILIICGPGNNGGDGFVMGRYLYKRSLSLEILLLCPHEKLSGDALLNYKRAKELSINILEVKEVTKDIKSKIKRSNLIIDAVFGTGLRSAPRGIFKEIIELVNQSEKQVAAVDIPSGINADTGEILETAIKADKTITFGFPKPAHYLNPGKISTGELFVADIGIPETISDLFPYDKRIITKEFFREKIQKRDKNSHKGKFGHLLVIGGSKEKPGAAIMASKAAHRAGAGLVTLLSPQMDTSSCFNETMKVSFESKTGEFEETDEKILENILEGKTAIVIGPGMGTGKGALKILEYLVCKTRIPMVIDADGLNILSENKELLKKLDKRIILTPHPKEMSRLSELSTSEILKDMIKTAKNFTNEISSCLVMKNSATIIAQENKKISINTTGNPGMSAGGSGDILAGIIGAFIANGVEPYDSAACGVYIHGLSADILMDEKGPVGYLPGEVSDNLPQAFKRIQK